VTYADTSRVSGVLGVDDVTVAGIEVQSQTFGLANVNIGSTAAPGVDGILGLGFDSNSEIGGKPFAVEEQERTFHQRWNTDQHEF